MHLRRETERDILIANLSSIFNDLLSLVQLFASINVTRLPLQLVSSFIHRPAVPADNTTMSSASGAEKTLDDVLVEAEQLMMAIIPMQKPWANKNLLGIAFMESEIHNRASKKATTSKAVIRVLKGLARCREDLKQLLKPESTNPSSVASGTVAASLGTTSESLLPLGSMETNVM